MDDAQPDEPEDLTRSDLRLIRGALRQDWPIPPAVKAKILQRLVDYLDRDHLEGATASDRHVLMAARTLAVFLGLTVRQQSLDLAREKFEGRQSEINPADLVREAERRAEERIRGRENEDGRPAVDDDPGR